jgi:hypothetical protein
MEMQTVRYFLALCEERSFTRAARRCGVTQPSLTRGIQQLEAEFGGALFIRAERTVTLTALGDAVRPHIAATAAAVVEAQRAAAAFNAAPPNAVVSCEPEEKTMRKAVFVTAAAVVLLLAAGAFSQLSQLANAGPRRLAAGVDIGAMSRSLDTRSLPQQELSPDSYQ